MSKTSDRRFAIYILIYSIIWLGISIAWLFTEFKIPVINLAMAIASAIMAINMSLLIFESE